MPQGKGTYGSKVGRPPKKKYQSGGSLNQAMESFVKPLIEKEASNPGGGNVPNDIRGRMASSEVDPFSTRNPGGVPARQAIEAMEQKNRAIPTANAMERRQVTPDTEQYNDGGKVKSKKVDVTDVVKKAGEWEGFYYPKREEFEGYPEKKVYPVSVISEGKKIQKKAVRALAKKALKGKKK